MSSTRFEPVSPASEQQQTYILDHVATSSAMQVIHNVKLGHEYEQITGVYTEYSGMKGYEIVKVTK